MAIANKDRFIDRAEIRTSVETVISYGYDLTAASIFVVTEWHAAVGTPVSLRISFPRILEPIDLKARISDIRIGGEPGEAGGIKLEFDEIAGEASARLVSLLERVRTRPALSPEGDPPCRVLFVEDSPLIRHVFSYRSATF